MCSGEPDCHRATAYFCRSAGASRTGERHRRRDEAPCLPQAAPPWPTDRAMNETMGVGVDRCNAEITTRMHPPVPVSYAEAAQPASFRLRPQFALDLEHRPDEETRRGDHRALGRAPKSAADDENEPITSWRSESWILLTSGLCRRDTIVATPSRPSTTARLVGRCVNTPTAFETSRRRQRLQRSPGPQTGCSTRQ